MKIRTHRYENENWGRAHLPFFKEFDKYLSKFFDVESINYNRDGNTFKGEIELTKSVGSFKNTPPISDVECVIENIETGEIKLISFTEYFNHYSCHITKSETCTKTLLAHFNWTNVYHWMKREGSLKDIYKISPWIFLPFQEFDFVGYRKKRNEINVLNQKMFWQGSGADSYRKMIKSIENKGFLQPIVPMSHNDYLETLINSKIGLSYYLGLDKYTTPFDHPGEFCYRDIEYTLLGIPYIRIEFKDSVYDPFIPNKHYISIPREKAYVEYEKNGDEGVADLYIEKYKEVINDDDFLNYISKNQIEWVENNLLGDVKFDLTFKLLELDKWLNK
jgi:hypothetical protein